VDSLVAENFDQEFARTIHYSRLTSELWHRRNETDNLHDAGDSVEITNCQLDRREQ
jgi:hypothetical protein